VTLEPPNLSLGESLVEPDAKGRLLASTDTGAVWTDFCAGAQEAHRSQAAVAFSL
jgi:hypothetical protein